MNGTASTLAQIDYSASGGKVKSVKSGTFFFYSRITTEVPNQVVTVTQSNTSTNDAALFGIPDGQAQLSNTDCSTSAVGTVTGPNGSDASFSVPVPGNYLIDRARPDRHENPLIGVLIGAGRFELPTSSPPD